MLNTDTVELGPRTYTVVEQPIGYLRKYLGEAIAEVTDLNFEGGDILTVVGDQAYAFLNVFIPDLMPEHEFHGFASTEAQERGDYRREDDKSPSVKQIRHAFDVAANTSGLDIVKHLKGLVGGDFLRVWVQKFLADQLTDSPSPTPSLETASAMTTGGPSNTSGTNGATSSTPPESSGEGETASQDGPTRPLAAVASPSADPEN